MLHESKGPDLGTDETIRRPKNDKSTNTHTARQQNQVSKEMGAPMAHGMRQGMLGAPQSTSLKLQGQVHKECTSKGVRSIERINWQD